MKQTNIFGEVNETDEFGNIKPKQMERTREEKLNLEWNILMGLFRATCEQQSMLIGETRHRAKLIFKRWQREGEMLLKIIEDRSSEELLNEMTELFEETTNKLRD